MYKARIDITKYPLKAGESWWIVHPNLSKCEFKVPSGAVTVCTKSIFSFRKNIAYNILGDDPHNGWITVQSPTEIIEMPYYLFARYFDAEAFVRGILKDPSELEGAVPFNYRPTLPKKIEVFEDGK